MKRRRRWSQQEAMSTTTVEMVNIIIPTFVHFPLSMMYMHAVTISTQCAPDSPSKLDLDEDTTFQSLVQLIQGKTKEALETLKGKERGGVLKMDDLICLGTGDARHVRDVLMEKHPPGQPADPNSLLQDETPPVHPVVFDSIDFNLIKTAALRTSGSAGPSGLDAQAWRRLCTCFDSYSRDLCQALAGVAKRLCTEFVDPVNLAPFLASRLVALDKRPGVRPIGVGDTARRVIAKSILMIMRDDILDVTGTLQLCAGQIAGCEAAIHTVRHIFNSDECEALLLVDATNAFNCLNRQTALRNIKTMCPLFATPVINIYRHTIDLFVGGEVIKSCEGTTQGDPLAMAIYAIATIPLIKKLSMDLTQIWYADDAASMGRIHQIREWWNDLVKLGPGYGYHPNAAKTWLITKDKHLPLAKVMFEGTGVQITTEGRPYLGAPIGCSDYIESFVRDRVHQWSSELEVLTNFAKIQPHAAYSALTKGLTSNWSYVIRTTPTINHLLQPLEDVIRLKLIPA